MKQKPFAILLIILEFYNENSQKFFITQDYMQFFYMKHIRLLTKEKQMYIINIPHYENCYFDLVKYTFLVIRNACRLCKRMNENKI